MKRLNELNTFEDIMKELEEIGFKIEEEKTIEECDWDDEDGRAEVKKISGGYEDELNYIGFTIENVKWRQRFEEDGELVDCTSSFLKLWFNYEEDNDVQYEFAGDEDGYEAAEELYEEIERNW